MAYFFGPPCILMHSQLLYRLVAFSTFVCRPTDESTSNWRVLSSRHCLAEVIPSYLADDTHLVSEGPRRRLRSSTDRSCAVPCTHNIFGDRSFAVAGPRVWNSLPANLRDEDITYTSFRRELKTYCGFLAAGAQCDILLNWATELNWTEANYATLLTYKVAVTRHSLSVFVCVQLADDVWRGVVYCKVLN